MKKLIFALFSLFLSLTTFAQKDHYQHIKFTEADTLRGMLRPERTCYDVYFYDLNIKVDINKKAIAGHVDIYYHALEDFTRLQIDLYQNMKIQKIEFGNKQLKYERPEKHTLILYHSLNYCLFQTWFLR